MVGWQGRKGGEGRGGGAVFFKNSNLRRGLRFCSLF